ncbi:hypothetical protein UFOVP1290_410 [uncultured Caudovirales phage]|uniref:Uncharacterized protein n=1 Tax=uncultured Caudovirales phage TaxID=2100421 RepID=A0A6J5RHC9_9CAUD|nr:hypothetical protein UFOVP1290_410 [uncultured Caudovirales phage]
MNNELAKKILEKLSLKDLYNEIKDNDNMIYALGKILVLKKKVTFCKFIRLLIEESIQSKDKDMIEFFKEEIINMDGTENLSVNHATKRKVAESVKPIVTSVSNNSCGSIGASSGRLSPSC